MAEKTTKLTYVGPHVAVELERPDGSIAEVEAGGVLETTAEHAERLLDQPSNWQPVKAAAKPAKAEKEEVA